jgi:hypothetical protein
MGGVYGMYEGEERWIKDTGWRPEGNRLLGRSGSRKEDNIKMDFQQVR